MSAKRKGEEDQNPRFRTGRFVHNDEKWYYQTREGTMEGPFRTQPEAEEHLRSYVNLLNSGWWNVDTEELELEPVKDESETAPEHEPDDRMWATRKGR